MFDEFSDEFNNLDKDSFFRKKAFLIENLVNEGNFSELKKELKFINNFEINDLDLFSNYLSYDFGDLELICKSDEHLNYLEKIPVQYLDDFFFVVDELENLEFNNPVFNNYVSLVDRKRKIFDNLNFYERRVIDNSLDSLFDLLNKELYENYFLLKNNNIDSISMIKSFGFDFSEILERSRIIENILNVDDSYLDFFVYTLNFVKKAKVNFVKGKYKTGFDVLNQAEEYIDKNNAKQSSLFETVKNDMINERISFHLENGFYSAENRDETLMNTELNKARYLMAASGFYNESKLSVIESVCYKENLSWAVKELSAEFAKDNPDIQHIKKVASLYRRSSNNLKESSIVNLWFAKLYDEKFSKISVFGSEKLNGFVF